MTGTCALSESIRRGQDLTPAMRSIGDALVNSTRERFRNEEAPDGTRWAELSDVTKKRRKYPGKNILTQEGFLGGASINSDAGPDWVEVGSSSVKANVLHFGAKAGEFGGVRTALPGRNFFQKIPWGDIPARPFVGLSDADGDIVRREILDYIAAPWT